MAKEIFAVNAYIVDANGTFNVLSGYPKTFNSTTYEDQTIEDLPTRYAKAIAKARQRAIGEWHEAMGAFAKRDDRLIQYANVVQMGAGAVIQNGVLGAWPADPEPNGGEE